MDAGVAAVDQYRAGAWERLLTSTEQRIDATKFIPAYKHESRVLELRRLEGRLARYRTQSDYRTGRSAGSGR